MESVLPAPTGTPPGRAAWSAVGSMTLCVALLIASEFMPVSLLTPIAHDLGATKAWPGQAISISGLFAVVTSLLIATIASRFDRRHVLMVLTAVMGASLALIALAPNFAFLMVARALLGVTIGGFWSLSTATLMRLVPEAVVPKAVGVLYMGNAVATAVAAPIGSYLGGVIGWRGVFWAAGAAHRPQPGLAMDQPAVDAAAKGRADRPRAGAARRRHVRRRWSP
jgi:predicted MFS family arabinose efflux permease